MVLAYQISSASAAQLWKQLFGCSLWQSHTSLVKQQCFAVVATQAASLSSFALLKKAEEQQDITARRFLLKACAVFWRNKCIEKIKPDTKSLYTVRKLYTQEQPGVEGCVETDEAGYHGVLWKKEEILPAHQVHPAFPGLQLTLST